MLFDDDDLLNSDDATTIVTVINVAPTIEIVSFLDSSYSEGEVATIAGVIADVGTLDTHTASVNWGDGTSSLATMDPDSRTFSASHVYLDDNPTGTPADVYTAIVTVMDDDGGEGSGQRFRDH